ncbi:MAG TPA: hypothetical protein VMV49_03985, partial [Candidatus Deferrimicrobium sp.]|nr:hypothetical protein [Candidatus Deferrimicrobium sp.]
LNIANTTSLYVLIINLPDGDYQFCIKAMDALGHFSESSLVLGVQVQTGEPPNYLLMILIILIGAVVGIVLGRFSYSKGVGKTPPLVAPKEKLSWISKALGYSPEFEQKLLSLWKNPQKFETIQDNELIQFFNKFFTTLPNTILTQLDHMPLSESEKIEILQNLLNISPEKRQQLFNELDEEQREGSP